MPIIDSEVQQYAVVSYDVAGADLDDYLYKVRVVYYFADVPNTTKLLAAEKGMAGLTTAHARRIKETMGQVGMHAKGGNVARLSDEKFEQDGLVRFCMLAFFE